MELKGLAFAKGHGTGNDFVIVADPYDELALSATAVAALCDRRRGIGADGLLRVVRDHGEADWFMDYRNADGSLAEMCGNGARVYARYLVESGLAPGPRVTIRTRAGVVHAEVTQDLVTVQMPVPEVFGPSSVRLSDVEIAGTVATCGNPNLVCWVGDPDRLDLTTRLELDEETFPMGANVEFVTDVTDVIDDTDVTDGGSAVGRPHVRMRVVERGVGETLSCGSGACAVAGVVLGRAGRTDGTVTVDVPGGRLVVGLSPGRCLLTGPAVIVATGTIALL